MKADGKPGVRAPDRAGAAGAYPDTHLAFGHNKVDHLAIPVGRCQHGAISHQIQVRIVGHRRQAGSDLTLQGRAAGEFDRDEWIEADAKNPQSRSTNAPIIAMK